MSRNFVLTVLLITTLFIGAYLVWTTVIFPRPRSATSDPASGQTPSISRSVPAITPNPTIVTATLNKDGIPLRLGALELVDSALGKDALAEFDKLHGQSFALLGGYRAGYVKGDNRATLWVGQAADASAAQAMLQAMAEKIAAGNAMFTDLKELSIANRSIFQVNGQGQQHFFYVINDKIVWLAANADYAPDALHSLWSAVK